MTDLLFLVILADTKIATKDSITSGWERQGIVFPHILFQHCNLTVLRLDVHLYFVPLCFGLKLTLRNVFRETIWKLDWYYYSWYWLIFKKMTCTRFCGRLREVICCKGYFLWKSHWLFSNAWTIFFLI